jgi:magnesium chelatase subunit D
VVAKEDVRAAARLALPHRRRRDPFDEPGMDERDLDETLAGADSTPDAVGDAVNDSSLSLTSLSAGCDG